MANLGLFRGGSPVVKYSWKDSDWAQFEPPFGQATLEDTPPYDSHADGAYNAGDFVLGFPLKPNLGGMDWQRRALANAKLAVGDVLQLIWLPADHMATFLNIKSIGSDSNMAGATIALQHQTLSRDTDGNIEITDTDTLSTAITAQGGSNVFDLSAPFNQMVSLIDVSSGYARPMYSTPPLPAASASATPVHAVFHMFGIKILSLPTDTAITLDKMRKGVYLSLRMQAFECPTFI